MKVLLDTNVMLSGMLAPGGTPGRILGAWDRGQFDLVSCQAQLEELLRVLNYPKIRRPLAARGVDSESFLKQMMLRAAIVPLPRKPARVVRDSDDDYLIAALVASEAEALISGDGDLLALRAEYPVITPGEFALRL